MALPLLMALENDFIFQLHLAAHVTSPLEPGFSSVFVNLEFPLILSLSLYQILSVLTHMVQLQPHSQPSSLIPQSSPLPQKQSLLPGSHVSFPP